MACKLRGIGGERQLLKPGTDMAAKRTK